MAKIGLQTFSAHAEVRGVLEPVPSVEARGRGMSLSRGARERVGASNGSSCRSPSVDAFAISSGERWVLPSRVTLIIKSVFYAMFLSIVRNLEGCPWTRSQSRVSFEVITLLFRQ